MYNFNETINVRFCNADKDNSYTALWLFLGQYYKILNGCFRR